MIKDTIRKRIIPATRVIVNNNRSGVEIVLSLIKNLSIFKKNKINFS